MPIRRRVIRRGGRRGRPRTRWLAINAGSRAGMTNNTLYFNSISLSDSSGAVNFADYTGGTILRWIMDLTFSPGTYGGATGRTLNSYIVHAGLFLDQTIANPDSTLWDPNAPFGDFMLRDQASVWFDQDSTNTAFSFGQGYNGRNIHFDTRVRRRIRENDRMWLSTHSFVGGLWTTVDMGFTGRVLVAIP